MNVKNHFTTHEYVVVPKKESTKNVVNRLRNHLNQSINHSNISPYNYSIDQDTDENDKDDIDVKADVDDEKDVISEYINFYPSDYNYSFNYSSESPIANSHILSALQNASKGFYNHNGEVIEITDKSKGQCTYGPSTFYASLGLQGYFWKGSNSDNSNNPKTAVDTNLTKKGFEKVWTGSYDDVKQDESGFRTNILKPGDLVITYGVKEKKDGSEENSSHIAMWTGKEFISDFKQKGMFVYNKERMGTDGSVQVLRLKNPQVELAKKGTKLEKEEKEKTYTIEKDILENIRKKWPALRNIQFTIVSDPNFTREATGAGSIEYINEPSISYPNGYVLNNPTNGPTIIYNPNDNTEDDVMLDALHALRDLDPHYKVLLKNYEDAQMEHNFFDILYNSQYYDQLRKYSQEYVDSEDFQKELEQIPYEYIIQGVDGSLRGLLAPDIIREKSGYQSKEDAINSWLNHKDINNAYIALKHYLESGTSPIIKNEQGAKIIVIEKEVIKEPEEEKDPLKCLLCQIMNAMGHRHHAFSELRPDKLTDIFGGDSEIVIKLGGPEKAYDEDSFEEMLKDILPVISTSKKYTKDDIKDIRSKKSEHGTSMKRLLSLLDDDKILKAFHGMQLFKSGGEIQLDAKGGQIETMSKITIQIGDNEYQVYEAKTDEQKKTGLKGVTKLQPNEGMIFYWDEPQDNLTMTMVDCEIPLKIVSFDEDLEATECPICSPDENPIIMPTGTKYVVELHPDSDVKIGDELDLPNNDDDEYVMQVLGSDGSIQMQLKGGERIFSRPNTKILLKWAKQAYNSNNPSDFARLGKLLFKYLDKQDNREPEYVSLDDKNK